MVLLGATAALDLRAEGPMPALLPVQLLAVLTAVARLAYAASKALVFEGRSARGAVREDHMSLKAAPICYLCILKLRGLGVEGQVS